MAKNKDINISPSKGISIVIKNEFPSQLPINQKRKENINVSTHYQKKPAPTTMQSAGDTS